MIKPKTSKQRLLPLVLLPLFSVAVLAGCGSDDDDDGGDVTPPVTDGGETPPGPDGGETPTDGAIVGDADGSGVPDAFEIATTGGADANGNGIDDDFDSTITGGADSNGNEVDDSFEAALGGVDADGDGLIQTM